MARIKLPSTKDWKTLVILSKMEREATVVGIEDEARLLEKIIAFELYSTIKKIDKRK